MTARRYSSLRCYWITPGAALAAWIGALYSVPRLILPTSLDSIRIGDSKAEYMYRHDFVYRHRYRWVSGRKCHVMCVLPNGVGCRAPIQAASAAPGVARQHREDGTRTPWSCHLRGQLACKRQTLSEATAHSRPPCVHLTPLT